MAGKKIKQEIMGHNKRQVYYKLVTSDSCKGCPTPCARGIRYVKMMERPGAKGIGIPCPLTGYTLNK